MVNQIFRSALIAIYLTLQSISSTTHQSPFKPKRHIKQLYIITRTSNKLHNHPYHVTSHHTKERVDAGVGISRGRVELEVEVEFEKSGLLIIGRGVDDGEGDEEARTRLSTVTV